MKRRAFCERACGAISAAALASSLAGCSSPTSPSSRSVPALPTINGTVSGSVVSIAVGGSALANVGGAALVQSSRGNFLVVHAADTAFRAFTAVCTHETCTITGFDGSLFVCPCHGSEFNTNGGVSKGPAGSSLRQFTTQFANDVLTIS